jgi:uracil-DNA glycosylase
MSLPSQFYLAVFLVELQNWGLFIKACLLPLPNKLQTMTFKNSAPFENPFKIEESWLKVIESQFKLSYFAKIMTFLAETKASDKTVYPPEHLIFQALNATPFEQVRVVILGQDPYHNQGEAMGLSFSVPRGVRVPASLKNIYKELHSDLGIEPATHGDLTAWAQQGVLLLNTSLTVEQNQPASHSKIGWQFFTDEIIIRLASQQRPIAFMLWGKHAQTKIPLIEANKQHLILVAAHPSPLARGAFFGSKPFSQANDWLMSQGGEGINW